MNVIPDIDECARGDHDCTGVLMHCVNRQGSYLCECADGFQVNHALRTCEGSESIRN